METSKPKVIFLNNRITAITFWNRVQRPFIRPRLRHGAICIVLLLFIIKSLFILQIRLYSAVLENKHNSLNSGNLKYYQADVCWQGKRREGLMVRVSVVRVLWSG